MESSDGHGLRRTVQVTRKYAHPPERVYAAWLDPASARQWLFATPAGAMVRAEIDPRVGGSFTFTDRRDGEDIDHVGEFVALEPPRRIAFRFSVPKFTTEQTLVTVEIAPDGAGSTLTLTHAGVWGDYAERTQQGWDMILAGLGQALNG
jgi:uncharacterized protein YndB with AHSA1/START domain